MKTISSTAITLVIANGARIDAYFKISKLKRKFCSAVDDENKKFFLSSSRR